MQRCLRRHTGVVQPQPPVACLGQRTRQGQAQASCVPVMQEQPKRTDAKWGHSVKRDTHTRHKDPKRHHRHLPHPTPHPPPFTQASTYTKYIHDTDRHTHSPDITHTPTRSWLHGHVQCWSRERVVGEVRCWDGDEGRLTSSPSTQGVTPQCTAAAHVGRGGLDGLPALCKTDTRRQKAYRAHNSDVPRNLRSISPKAPNVTG